MASGHRERSPCTGNANINAWVFVCGIGNGLGNGQHWCAYSEDVQIRLFDARRETTAQNRVVHHIVLPHMADQGYTYTVNLVNEHEMFQENNLGVRREIRLRRRVAPDSMNDPSSRARRMAHTSQAHTQAQEWVWHHVPLHRRRWDWSPLLRRVLEHQNPYPFLTPLGGLIQHVGPTSNHRYTVADLGIDNPGILDVDVRELAELIWGVQQYGLHYPEAPEDSADDL